MEILVKMAIISQTNGVHNIFHIEGDDFLSANVKEEIFSLSQLETMSYDAVPFSEGEHSIETVEVNIDGKDYLVNSTLEDFEEKLSQLGLLDVNTAEVIEIKDYQEEQQTEQMVA